MTFFIVLAVSGVFFLLLRSFIKDSTKTTHSLTARVDHVSGTFTTLTPDEFAERYKSQKGQYKGGTLCFWGHWFGKPYDNFHQITFVDFDAHTHVLTIRFSEHETLTVTGPADIRQYEDRLVITNAEKVYWQWYYYGKIQEPENLYYYDFHREEGSVSATTNVDWYKVDWRNLTQTKPAVLLT